MAGPNREWHVGDHGPGPVGWSQRERHPRAARDPHDSVTQELPLEQPIPDDVAVRIAAGLYEEADDEVPWLLMMLKADADHESGFKMGPRW